MPLPTGDGAAALRFWDKHSVGRIQMVEDDGNGILIARFSPGELVAGD